MHLKSTLELKKVTLFFMGVYLFVLPMPSVVTIREGSFFLAILLVAVSYFTGRRRWEWPPLKVLLLLLVCLSLLSIFASEDVLSSLSETKKEVVYPILAFWLFFVVVRSRRDFISLSLVAISSTTVLILAGIFSYYYLGLLAGMLADNSGYLYGNTAYYSFYMLSTAALCSIFAMSNGVGKVLRWYSAVLIPFSFLGVYFARHRSGYLAIVLSICVYLIYTQVVRKGIARKSFVVACVLVVFLLVPGLIANKEITIAVNPTKISKAFASLVKEERFIIWKASVNEIRERPFLGKGFGNKELVIPSLIPLRGPRIYPHNLFLSYGVMVGVLGVPLLIILFVRLFVLLQREAMRFVGVDPLRFGINLSGILILLTFVLFNITADVMTRQTGQLFWALMGMVLGGCRTVEVEESKTSCNG